MQWFRRATLLLLLVALTGCGEGSLGGSDPTVPDTGQPSNDNNGNNSNVEPKSGTGSITLNLQDLQGNPISDISAAVPGVLYACLVDDDQLPVQQALLQFSVTAGKLERETGRKLTGADGCASLGLTAGTEPDAGVATVSYDEDTDVLTDSLTFDTAGDEVGGVTPVTEPRFTLRLLNHQGSTVSLISADVPGRIEACATNSMGTPYVQEVVEFSTTAGRIGLKSGTSLTNDQGCAYMDLLAGTETGAGYASATLGSLSGSVGFQTAGDEVDPSLVPLRFDIATYSCPSGWDRQERDLTLCLPSVAITPTSPAVLAITVTHAENNLPLDNLLVSAQSQIGRILPELGTAVTNDQGVALLDLLAGAESGAGLLTVSALGQSSSEAVQVGESNLNIGITTDLPVSTSLAAGSATVVTVYLCQDGVSDCGPSTADDDLYKQPVTVELSSSCLLREEAELDASVVSIGGIARSTYRAMSCQGADWITASAKTGGQALTAGLELFVDTAEANAIEFIEAEHQYLTLKGTGSQETGMVTFRLLGEAGYPMTNHYLAFEQLGGGAAASVSPVCKATDSDGYVSTTVLSGSTPGTVRVRASYVGELPTLCDQILAGGTQDTRIATVSDEIVISTGLPEQSNFSLSLDVHNPEALNYDGEVVSVTARAADHANNPVPDGTAIYFTSEGGLIESGCFTENGACSVDWYSQDRRPFVESVYQNTIADVGCEYFELTAPCINGELSEPRGGRVTILAHAKGEEQFVDLNANGVFDSNEFNALFDLTEAFVDDNEDGKYDGRDTNTDPANSDGGEFEEFVDRNLDGSFTGKDNKFNGLLCTEAANQAGLCNWELIHVRESQVLTMSGSDVYLRITKWDEAQDRYRDKQAVDLRTSCSDPMYSDESSCTQVAGIWGPWMACSIPGLYDRSSCENYPVNQGGPGTWDMVFECSNGQSANEADCIGADAVWYVPNVCSDPYYATQDACESPRGEWYPDAVPFEVVRIFMSDIFNNPPPAGTTIEVSTSNGVISSGNSFTVPSTSSPYPLSFPVSLEREKEPNKSSAGSMVIKATTPKGLESSLSIPVYDNG